MPIKKEDKMESSFPPGVVVVELLFNHSLFW